MQHSLDKLEGLESTFVKELYQFTDGNTYTQKNITVFRELFHQIDLEARRMVAESKMEMIDDNVIIDEMWHVEDGLMIKIVDEFCAQ